MNPGKIWWGQIGNSLRFLTGVANSLRDCHSAVLQVPRELPWRREFYDAVDLRRSAFGDDRRLMRLDGAAVTEPGEFILDELCSSRVRANYWPGVSYAEYLGKMEDLVLNDYIVWVTGIHKKSALGKWAEFVTRYERAAEERDRHAVFVLEYDGPATEVQGMAWIAYEVKHYDCRVFCLEAAAALENAELRSYQAELALCIGQGEPELCAALLSRGEALLKEPVSTAGTLLEEGRSSGGAPFPAMTEQEIERAVWKAATVLLFPVLEEYRADFIKAHEGELARHLPISNSNGDRITDPQDLELGPLQYIVSSARGSFTPEETELVRLCRYARNQLAHNKQVPYESLEKLIRL